MNILYFAGGIIFLLIVGSLWIDRAKKDMKADQVELNTGLAISLARFRKPFDVNLFPHASESEMARYRDAYLERVLSNGHEDGKDSDYFINHMGFYAVGEKGVSTVIDTEALAVYEKGRKMGMHYRRSLGFPAVGF